MGQQDKGTKDKKCDECDFVTHKAYNLKKHKECHVKFTQKLLETLKCSECDKTFTNKKTLGDHIKHLQELSTMLPVEAESFLNYFRSIKELHSAVVSKEYSYSRCEKSVFDYEVNFWHLHEQFSLPMTLKVHVILDHYMWYFKEMGTNFHDTNGEYVEAVHYSLEGHKNTRN